MKKVLPLLPMLLFSVVLWAHSIEPLKKLPPRMVEVPLSPPSVEWMAVQQKAEAGAYFFPELEAQVAAWETAAAPPPAASGFSSFMVQVGKGQLSKDAKKAKEIIDKAINVGNWVDKLTGGNLVKMPLAKSLLEIYPSGCAC